jgi:ketosteroid isomerase-like protein
MIGAEETEVAMVRLGVMMFALIAAAPALAAWTTTSDTVRAAAKDPAVASALAAMNRIDVAIVAGDRDSFVGAFADDAVVNSPFNNVADKTLATQRFKNGTIDYAAMDRVIDYVGVRKSGEVVAMGEEIIKPRGEALHAGKTIRRRFTDIWRNDGGTWKLALRQATIIEVK